MYFAAITWTDKLTAIGTAVGAGVVVLSAIIALVQLREAERTRLAGLVADLSRRWDEELLKTARKRHAEVDPDQLLDLVEKSWTSGKADEKYYELEALPNFFEGLGVLEDRTRGLSIALVSELWGGAVLRAWAKWLPTVEYIRTAGQDAASAYANFELIQIRVAAFRKEEAAPVLCRWLYRARRRVHRPKRRVPEGGVRVSGPGSGGKS